MSNSVSTRRQIRPVERIRNTRPINGAYCAIRLDFLTVLSQDRSKPSASRFFFSDGILKIGKLLSLEIKQLVHGTYQSGIIETS